MSKIKLNIFFTILLLLICSMVFHACRKEKPNPDELMLEQLFGEFGIIDSLKTNKTSVDFASGEKIYFTAKFKSIIKWQIDITQDSTTRFIMTGKSSYLDATNASWDGSSTILPVFKNDSVKAKISFEGRTDTMSVKFKISSVKLATGTLINDFGCGFLQPLWRPKWIQSGVTMDVFKTYQYKRGLDTINTNLTSPFNNDFLIIAGTVNWDWLIAYVEIPSSAVYQTNYFPGLINLSNKVYFNAYIYSDTSGCNKEAKLEFQFHEDDNGDNKNIAGTDDTYLYDITLNWVGWKKISIRYDSIPVVFTPPEGQVKDFGGNQLPQPANILAVRIMLLGNPAKGKTICGLDEIILTNNNPFKP
ncbi:MAG: hypothetical protein PHD97_10110 [Bacteroidales bacterium]|nr:hypothetical protein [Bacteroidales bacterium]